jgi:RHS repeat-associated protein
MSKPYTANSLNQYTQRAVPGYVDIIGSAHSQAVVTVNNQPVTRQEGGYFHKGLTISNSASMAYQAVSVVGVRPNAGSNGNDIVSIETGVVFVAQTPESFTYDADGNLLTDARWTNTWDGEGRLVRMETLAGLPSNVPRQRIEFLYDSVGKMIKRTILSNYIGGNFGTTGVTFHVWDGWLPVLEQGNGLTNSFTWGLDLSGSMRGVAGVGGLLSIRSGTNVSLYCHDGNGNVSALFGVPSGSVVAKYEYDPYGRALRTSGSQSSINPFRFSSRLADRISEYVFALNRFYMPILGAWASRDHVEGLNTYAFVECQPVNRIDPYGLFSWSFTASDLGSRDPIPVPDHPGLFVRGHTSLDSWQVSTRRVSCDSATKRLDVSGSAAVSFWWFRAPDRQHEMHHVDLYRGGWQELKANVLQYTVCMCSAKLPCYERLIDLLSQAHQTRTQQRNKAFDCSAYGDVTGACSEARRLEEQFNREWTAVQDQYKRCSGK